MKIRQRNLILCTLVLFLAGCGAQQASRMEYIGADDAKSLALEAAGLTTSQVDSSSTDMSTREGLDYYQVEFTAGGQSYRYDIDALTGTVIDYQCPPEGDGGASTVPKAGQRTGSLVTDADTYGTVQQAPAASIQNTPSAGGSKIISTEEAKAAALAHAGLAADQVTFVKDGLDWDDGRQAYDLEFYTQDYREYDYDIDAYTGEVLSFDHDAEYYDRPVFTTGSGAITADDAKAKALAQVPGAAAADIREFETDFDDGRLEYEGKIYYDHMEYEFEIDGYSGAIRTWEVEPIYD